MRCPRLSRVTLLRSVRVWRRILPRGSQWHGRGRGVDYSRSRRTPRWLRPAGFGDAGVASVRARHVAVPSRPDSAAPKDARHVEAYQAGHDDQRDDADHQQGTRQPHRHGTRDDGRAQDEYARHTSSARANSSREGLYTDHHLRPVLFVRRRTIGHTVGLARCVRRVSLRARARTLTVPAQLNTQRLSGPPVEVGKTRAV